MRLLSKLLVVALFLFSIAAVSAGTAEALELVTNGGFETSDLTGWTLVDEAGGSGTFYVMSGTASPLNGFPVLAPPEGTYAAMTDQFGPGSHIIYQDIFVPVGGVVQFSATVYIENQGGAYVTGADLSYTTNPNQQMRVDIMDPAFPPNDVGFGVLLNVFQTIPAVTPLSLGYTTITADLSPYEGQTVRIRIAEVDNQGYFNGAVDNVSATSFGVADDVAGTDVVIPLICEKDGTMNTLWAVGDLFANGAADILVFDRRSELIYDDFEEWTSDAPDVVVSDCQTLVAAMSVNQKLALETSIGGRTYYVGYLVYFNVDANSDQFIPWVYLVDLVRGFASGYNGFSAEAGVDLDNLGEGLGLAPVTASALFPRYYIGNDNAETWNWWITLLGSNDADRELAGFICNEEEDCVSLSIPIPDELNIIDVEPYVPALLHAGYPKAGMGVFAVINGDDQFDITTLGWSYQRLEASTVSASWDVIHPMHRLYGFEQ